ncbi:MAG TPA: hypothetical protein VK196_22375 [Magnetospirillum sp.]|nr:hypothetical protein [Magnetospirillum sp.]
MFDPTDTAFFDPTPPQQRGPRPHLRFWVDTVPLPGKSAEEGRPVYKQVDMVTVTNPGSRDEVPLIAADKAKRDEYVAWAYRKWKATQEQPVDGTPLETVPFLNQAQVLELKGIGIHTLENLEHAPETAIQRMMGLRELKKKAAAYTAAAKDTALVTKLASELEQRDQTIELMKAQMEQMNARFEELSRKVGA